jgi:hypothetical protein
LPLDRHPFFFLVFKLSSNGISTRFLKALVGACAKTEEAPDFTKHLTLIRSKVPESGERAGSFGAFGKSAREKMPWAAIPHRTLHYFHIFFLFENLHDFWQMLSKQYLPHCLFYLFHTMQQSSFKFLAMQ